MDGELPDADAEGMMEEEEGEIIRTECGGEEELQLSPATGKEKEKQKEMGSSKSFTSCIGIAETDDTMLLSSTTSKASTLSSRKRRSRRGGWWWQKERFKG